MGLSCTVSEINSENCKFSPTYVFNALLKGFQLEFCNGGGFKKLEQSTSKNKLFYKIPPIFIPTSNHNLHGRRRGSRRPPAVGWSYLSVNTWSHQPPNFSHAGTIHQQCSLKQRMMEVVVTTGAISRAKLQSNHPHQQTNIQLFLQAGCPSRRPTTSVKALKVKISHSMDLLTPSSPGVFQLCF